MLTKQTNIDAPVVIYKSYSGHMNEKSNYPYLVHCLKRLMISTTEMTFHIVALLSENVL